MRRSRAQERAPALCVAPVATEALRSEAVGHAPSLELRESLPRQRRVWRGAAQPDLEAIPAQLAGAQFVAVGHRLEYAHPREPQREGALGLESGHREPLPRHGHAILAAGVAHVARAHPSQPRQRPRHLLAGDAALLDAQKGVAALARGCVERQLVDFEVLGSLGPPGRSGRHGARQKKESCDTGVKERR